MQPAQLGDNDTFRGIDGKPTKALADRCLYRLPLLRQAIEAGAPAAFWCEGEKDTQAGEELLIDSDLRERRNLTEIRPTQYAP